MDRIDNAPGFDSERVNKMGKTRMHEILGVEPFEKFQVVGGYEGRNYFLDGYGWMRWGDSDWESDVEDVYNAINNGIIRKPRLTAEQVTKLKALVVLGFVYLAIDRDGSVYAYQIKPSKKHNQWVGTEFNEPFAMLNKSDIRETLYPLVSWADPEPLDIVKTLRENGIEVDNA